MFFYAEIYIDINFKICYINNKVGCRGDRMKFRNFIFVLAIAFSVIFASMIGTSYAYYVATDGVPINVTTSDLDHGVAIVFEQSQYINSYTGIPIEEADILELANASVFRIIPDTDVLTGAEVSVNIGLVDLYIDNDLVIDDFKYGFSCNDGTSDVITSSGSGSNFTVDVLTNDYIRLGVLDTITGTFDVNKQYTCTLRIWLQNNPNVENQNDLMNKQFSGLIKVNTIFKK